MEAGKHWGDFPGFFFDPTSLSVFWSMFFVVFCGGAGREVLKSETPPQEIFRGRYCNGPVTCRQGSAAREAWANGSGVLKLMQLKNSEKTHDMRGFHMVSIWFEIGKVGKVGKVDEFVVQVQLLRLLQQELFGSSEVVFQTEVLLERRH